MSAPLEVRGTISPRRPVISVEVATPSDIPAQLIPTLTVRVGGNVTYTWPQTVPLAVWTIPHNMNRYPSVTVVDGLGNRVEPDVKYLDENIVQITHGGALAGLAYLN